MPWPKGKARKPPANYTPKLVFRLRAMTKDHPLNAHILKQKANLLMLTLKSLGLEAAPEDPGRREAWLFRLEHLGAYKAARQLHDMLTRGQKWRGEEPADVGA